MASVSPFMKFKNISESERSSSSTGVSVLEISVIFEVASVEAVSLSFSNFTLSVTLSCIGSSITSLVPPHAIIFPVIISINKMTSFFFIFITFPCYTITNYCKHITQK